MLYLIVFLWCLQFTIPAHILGIFPTPFYSHQSVFQPIWRELSSRGHKLTIITTNPINNKSLTSLTEIDLSFTHKLVFEDNQMLHVVNTESNILILMKHVFFVMNNMTQAQLLHPQIQKLITSNETFDAMLMEAHVPAWYGLAKLFKCPVVVMTSMEATNHFKRFMGNMHNPIVSSHVNLPFEKELNFFQRVVSVLFEIFDETLTDYFLYPAQERLIKQALHDEQINLFDIRNNVALMMVNVIPGFHKGVTKIPSIVELNGLQIRPPQMLPSDLQHFLDEAISGVIYFSLGSIVRSFLMPQAKQAILLKVFKELPFKVVWKFEDTTIDLPENVKVVKWAPQQDILRHKNTKLFITQGGLQSIDEAIRFKVPILGIPFFGDQFFNAKRVQHLQIGSMMDFNDLKKTQFKRLILQSVNNKTYLKNLEDMSVLLQHPDRSLEKAVWWIEYVVRHKGAKHLRSPLIDIPFYQYYMLDVILFIVCVTTVFAVICIKCIKQMCGKKLRKKVKVQ